MCFHIFKTWCFAEKKLLVSSLPLMLPALLFSENASSMMISRNKLYDLASGKGTYEWGVSGLKLFFVWALFLNFCSYLSCIIAISKSFPLLFQYFPFYFVKAQQCASCTHCLKLQSLKLNVFAGRFVAERSMPQSEFNFFNLKWDSQ